MSKGQDTHKPQSRQHDVDELLTDTERQRLDRLWRAAFPSLRRIAAGLFRNPADADELVSRFGEYISRPEKFRKYRSSGRPFRLFALFRMRSMAHDVRKQRAWRFAGVPIHDEQAVTDFAAHRPVSAVTAAPGREADAATAAAGCELRRAVRRAVVRLPRPQRRALLALELATEPQRVIGHRHGTNKDTLRKRRRTALEKLRQSLAAFGETGASEADLCSRILSLRRRRASNRQIAKRLGISEGGVSGIVARNAIRRQPDGSALVRLWVATDESGAVCFAATDYAAVKEYGAVSDVEVTVGKAVPQ